MKGACVKNLFWILTISVIISSNDKILHSTALFNLQQKLDDFKSYIESVQKIRLPTKIAYARDIQQVVLNSFQHSCTEICTRVLFQIGRKQIFFIARISQQF